MRWTHPHLVIFLFGLTAFACHPKDQPSPDADAHPSDADHDDVDADERSPDADGAQHDADAAQHDADADGVQHDADQQEIVAIQVPFYSEFGEVFFGVTLADVLVYLRYDTASPGIFLDPARASAVGIEEGTATARIGDLELGSPFVELFRYHGSDGNYPAVPGGIVHGIAGNELFLHHSVGLDFSTKQLWVAPAQPTSAEVPHPPELALLGTTPMDQPHGYVVVPCSFSASDSERRCLLDTGAPEPLTYDEIWTDQPHASDRAIPLVSEDFTGAELRGYLQRAEMVHMGPFEIPALPVAVFPGFSVVDEIGTLIGVELAGLIGVSFVRELYLVFDYGNDRLVAFAPSSRDHLPTDEFVGYGFVIGTETGFDLFVEEVVSDSDAERAGVEAGDVLEEIDGVPWWEFDRLSFASGHPGLIAGDLGETRTFTLDRRGEAIEVDIVAEDLLPFP